MDSESGDYDGKRKRNDRDKKDFKKKDNNKNVCRDFLRNACDRGDACKFNHSGQPRTVLSFCHDFQNGYCRRNKNCRFIHSSYDDENNYLMTGQLPSHLLDWHVKQKRSAVDGSDVPYCKKFVYGDCWDDDCGFQHVTVKDNQIREDKVPSPLETASEFNFFERGSILYCKDYLWAGCWNNNCRFKHVTRNEFRKMEGRSPTPPMGQTTQNNLLEQQNVGGYERRREFGDDCFEPEAKRPFIAKTDRMDSVNVSVFENTVPYQSQPERSCIMLEEENIMLRERITELKKRIDDLQITNEFLLNQNVRLRLQQDKSAAGLTTMTVPTVTINSVPAANQIQQNPTPQQMVTAALRTVTASVATVPVSIDTVTPVSLGAVSMAPVQQIPGSVMTIAQQGAPASEQQITQQPLPMSMSAPSVPLVSYPIVSRAVIQQSAPPPPSLRH